MIAIAKGHCLRGGRGWPFELSAQPELLAVNNTRERIRSITMKKPEALQAVHLASSKVKM